MKYGPLETPYNPGFETPGAGESTVAKPGDDALFEGAPPATANMSELPACSGVAVQNVPDAPAPGTAVEVDGKVTAPGIPFTQFGSK
jgi:hypothetical protein